MATTQEEKDGVTCGQLRALLEERLQDKLKTLTGILLSRDVPGSKIAKAEAFLKGAVAESLNELDTLNTWSGLPSLRKLLGE